MRSRVLARCSEKLLQPRAESRVGIKILLGIRHRNHIHAEACGEEGSGTGAVGRKTGPRQAKRGVGMHLWRQRGPRPPYELTPRFSQCWWSAPSPGLDCRWPAGGNCHERADRCFWSPSCAGTHRQEIELLDVALAKALPQLQRVVPPGHREATHVAATRKELGFLGTQRRLISP